MWETVLGREKEQYQKVSRWSKAETVCNYRFFFLNAISSKLGSPLCSYPDSLPSSDLWSVSVFHFAIQQPDIQKLCSDSLI